MSDNKKDKNYLGLDEKAPIPPLSKELDQYFHPSVHDAIAEFTTQAQIYFPQILTEERDQAVAKIYLDNLQEHITRTNQLTGQTSKQDTGKIVIALNTLSKIGEKKKDDMMACALLDYIDEILEMLDSKN